MDHHEGFFVSFFTALLFVVTGLLAVFTFQLVTDAKEANAKQVKATNKALVAAQQSASASAKQADASIAANRAYLRVTELSTEFFATESYRSQIGIGVEEGVGSSWTIRNFGSSPADIYCISYGGRCSIDEPTEFPTVVRDFTQTIAASETSGRFSEKIYVDIPSDLFEHFKIGIACIWIKIEFSYIDVFNEQQCEVALLRYARDKKGIWNGGIVIADHRSLREKNHTKEP